ncbi:hypothetical protein RI845_01670 [Thalassotalea nanhaiensis]|uniref:Benenodin family lasso peptide n=1 Tax=Thalassotalea nanhaiensis TaxID=3065648 RepID=A0ABY9TJU2_9GAMM|nr:hypothetical protein RI845_01670 [Colwelliaceae bacterium SQ345]
MNKKENELQYANEEETQESSLIYGIEDEQEGIDNDQSNSYVLGYN